MHGDLRYSMLGQRYRDEQDSGDLEMEIVAPCSLVNTDVIVSPVGIDRYWSRNAKVIQALIVDKIPD